MTVTRVRETPRTTKPYTEAQWQAILARGAGGRARHCGAATCGSPWAASRPSSPTDDMDGAGWNTRRWARPSGALAGRLFRRLRDRCVARRRCCISARANGIPASSCRAGRWTATGARTASRSGAIPALLRLGRRQPTAPRPRCRPLRPSLRRAAAARSRHLFSAFEDTWYYLWRERRLPTNVMVDDAKVKDPLERERLARGVRAGPRHAPSARVLPIRRVMHRRPRRWRSGPWFLRSAKCYLIPGDSPLGFRLPLDSLPWAAPADADAMSEPDPMRRIRRCRRSSLPPRTGAAPPGRRPVADDRRRRRCPPRGLAARAGARSRAQAAAPVIGRRPASCAPRWPSSRATAISTSSCRRPSAPRIISTSPRRRGHRRGARPAGRSSKAIRRPATIRACNFSASRPIPA